MNEFEFISKHLAPLAGKAGLNLQDDAALLDTDSETQNVITMDTMVEGVHFPVGDRGAKTAGKLLRVNLSDLAAKGAEPLGYFLSIACPADITEAELKDFASGLAEGQAEFGLSLMGGDTVRTDGAMTVTATMIGHVPVGEFIFRSGARSGDDIWVTGAIGDAYLGCLQVTKRSGRSIGDDTAKLYLNNAYYRPEPRLNFRDILRENASACADISDGLVADAHHIAVASNVKLCINLADVNFSIVAGQWISRQDDKQTAAIALITGGDDYELIFTAPRAKRENIKKLASESNLPVTLTGEVKDGEGVIIRNRMMQDVEVKTAGYTHF